MFYRGNELFLDTLPNAKFLSKLLNLACHSSTMIITLLFQHPPFSVFEPKDHSYIQKARRIRRSIALRAGKMLRRWITDHVTPYDSTTRLWHFLSPWLITRWKTWNSLYHKIGKMPFRKADEIGKNVQGQSQRSCTAHKGILVRGGTVSTCLGTKHCGSHCWELYRLAWSFVTFPDSFFYFFYLHHVGHFEIIVLSCAVDGNTGLFNSLGHYRSQIRAKQINPASIYNTVI